MNTSILRAYTPVMLLLGLFSVAAVQHTGNSNDNLPVAISDTLETYGLAEGALLYRDSCAACHGIRGRGAPASQLGFATPIPDFSDCDFAAREPDADWIAVAHQGGPTRGFSTDMPAFGKVLTVAQIQQIMDHVRTLCTDKNWPRGELNLPRPLVTEKAYPEDETVLSTDILLEGPGLVMNKLIYEHRIGARSQLELVLPFGFGEDLGGGWRGGQLGDMALGFKHALYHNVNSGSIFSVTGEVILPTGDMATGFGKGTTVLEPFVTYGQILPANGFFQFQGGVELPMIADKAENEAFWRGALGTTFTQGQWGRAWSPMVEVLGSSELERGAQVHWDLVPQLQVTLNTRQHIMLNVGLRVPLDDPDRETRLMVYLLWDWFDGGLLEGW